MADTDYTYRLFCNIKDKDDRLIRRFGNTSDSLKRTGAGEFLLPAGSGGVFLILLGVAVRGLFSQEHTHTVSGAAVFLGMVLIACGVIFYAMFLRRAALAETTALFVCEKNVIYISGSSYLIMPVSDITGAWTVKADDPAKAGIELGMLCGEKLVLMYRDAPTELLYISEPSEAARIIGELFC